MIIRDANNADLPDVLYIVREAFKATNSDVLVKEEAYVNALLVDPTAKPLLSLLAFVDDKPVGHLLFTKAHLTPNPNNLQISFLSALAVLTDYQRQRIGTELIKKGLQQISKTGNDLVFVLGHPNYYTKHGFTPAGKQGFQTPYPLQEKDQSAWMVKELQNGKINSNSGKITFCDELNKPEYWQQ
ncbi:MAG: N-acetyltransferase [Candidatus Bathyarchaeota archaeon]|nr:N-acetyltransferase [Candidatus Bathyarchaeum tardum]WGM89069.1 MAG: N-acetyltransferase [Candidatus Bathyarchaeum tardum]WNZ28695.1 MAG: N-acetyltransferase [Candidatus Bathyarchaeota archaeon]